MTVPQVSWNDSYATGVAEIDAQHKILLHILNDARAKLSQSSAAQPIEPIVRDLLSYALYHFETEEALMLEFGYAGALDAEEAAHRGQHRAFTAKVKSVMEDLRGGEAVSVDDLLAFLYDWLIHHILNTDRKLGRFILERRAATSGVAP
jgi:hemerythrin-like metal-binding protein